MTRSLIAMGLAAAMLAAPTAARAQDATDVLTGRITDDTGRPVAQAEVEVVSLLTEIVKRTMTDRDGKYVLLFPDGGGQYQMTVRAIGLAERTLMVGREGVEEILITEVSLAVEGVALQGLDVSARRLPPGSGNAGARGIILPQRLIDRLPLPDFDPALLAALSPNVILTAGDTASDLSAFSVAGQRDALNQITLDGGSLTSVLGGQSGAGSIPEEGVRATQVVTSTYDVSRGQFSGGLIAMTSARGVNRPGGSTSYNVQDPSFASGNGAFLGGGTSQHRVSGGVGGALLPNKLFYSVSFSGQRRSDAMFALVPENQLDVLPLGASPDSIGMVRSYSAAEANSSNRSRSHAHCRRKPSSNGVLGSKPNSSRLRERSANVCCTSPGCMGSCSILGLFPTTAPTASIMSRRATGCEPPRLKMRNRPEA